MKYQIFFLLIFVSASSTVAQNSVKFQVREETGEALIGVNIIVKGTQEGTVTDTNGIAVLGNLPDGEVEIGISYVGFEEKEINLHFPQDNNKTIEIELEEGHEELEEVIIATTRSSRTIEDIPTRIEAITSEELGEKAAMNSSNIGMLLRETTGVQMHRCPGHALMPPRHMQIRLPG